VEKEYKYLRGEERERWVRRVCYEIGNGEWSLWRSHRLWKDTILSYTWFAHFHIFNNTVSIHYHFLFCFELILLS